MCSALQHENIAKELCGLIKGDADCVEEMQQAAGNCELIAEAMGRSSSNETLQVVLRTSEKKHYCVSYFRTLCMKTLFDVHRST